MCVSCPDIISIIFDSASFPGQFWMKIQISRPFFILNDGSGSIGDEFYIMSKFSSKWQCNKSPWTLSLGLLQTCRLEILNPYTYENFWLSSHLNWIVKKYRKNHQTIKKWWFFNEGYQKAEAACCARCPPAKKITLRGEALRVIPSGSPWDLGAGSRPEDSKYSKYRSGEILSCAPGRVCHVRVVPGHYFDNFQFCVIPRTILNQNSDSPTIFHPK